jgi:hypothetical protein
VQVVAQGATGAVIAGASHVAWTADDGAHVAVVTAGDSRALTAGAQGVVGGAGAEVRGLTDDADGGAAWIGVTHGPDVDMYALQGATASGAPVALPRVADADAGLRLVGTGSVAYAAYVRGKLQVAALRGGRADVRSLGVRPLGSPWNPAGFAIDGGQGGYVIAWSAEGRGGRADIWLRDPSSPTAWRVTRTARFDEFVDDVDTALLERPLVAGTRSVQRSRGVITGNDRPISAAVWPATGTPTIVSKPPRGEESAVRVVRAGDNAFTAWDHFDLDDQDGNLRARRVRAPISRFPSPSLIAAHGSCSSDEG